MNYGFEPFGCVLGLIDQIYFSLICGSSKKKTKMLLPLTEGKYGDFKERKLK
jgi:hypothetical protein